MIQIERKFVRFGEHDTRTDDDGPHQDFQIARAVRHEKFKSPQKTYDIAIIHIERDVEFSGNIRNDFCCIGVLWMHDTL